MKGGARHFNSKQNL